MPPIIRGIMPPPIIDGIMPPPIIDDIMPPPIIDGIMPLIVPFPIIGIAFIGSLLVKGIG